MLTALTHYLLQYKTVVIPQLGNINIHQQPAELSVADKQLSPPLYSVSINKTDALLPAHQINFLANALSIQGTEAESRLALLGEEMRKQLAADGFNWPGLGWLKDQAISVCADDLQPVTAEKIWRSASHPVRVGERRTTSAQIQNQRTLAPAAIVTKQFPWMLIGWLVFILSLIAIAVVFYLGHFTVSASGSKRPVSYQHVNQSLPTAI